MSWRTHIAGLLSLAATQFHPQATPAADTMGPYRAPGNRDADEVEEAEERERAIRRIFGGNIAPPPTTVTRWHLADLEAAQHEADVGNLQRAAQLCRSMRRDGVLAGVLSTCTASTAPPNTITDFVTKLLSVEVTNAAPLVGLDAEADPALRERCRDSLGSLSPNGPAAAYRYWAKSAKRSDGSAVGVTRVRLLPPPGNGSLTVVVATATGPVTGKADDPTTDLGAVYKAIQENAVPDGIGPVDVVSAVVHPVNVAYDVWVTTDSGMSTTDIQSAVSARLTQYFPTVPIGGFVIKPASGKVSWRALEGQIESVSPFVIEAKITPEVDAVMASTEVAVLGAVTPSVHLVAAAI